MPKAKRRKKTSREPEAVRRDGGLCPAFVNTASAKREPIGSYADLLVWCQRCGILDDAAALRLERDAGERPDAAGAALRRALELRDAMRRILLALAARETPPAADVEALNGVLDQARRRLVPTADGGHRWGWVDRDGDELEAPLWPVVISAAEILTTRFRRRVGQCAGEGCDLFFVDRASGSPRRWCEKRLCGQPVNSRRHYQRKIKPEREAWRRRYLSSGAD